MKFTLSWLHDHLETDASLEAICDTLVNLGLEVESVEDPGRTLADFLVGEIIRQEKHPNADRLNICHVQVGLGEPLQVVCGAHNVRPGLKIAFAPIGALIPETQQILKKGKIRGVESYGMICSASELNLPQDSHQEGILELSPTLLAGLPLAEALGLNDPVIELSITPNRSDCFGVRGIARDLASAGLGTLRPLPTPCLSPDPAVTPTLFDNQRIHVCTGFRLIHVTGVTNKESPLWLRRRLAAIHVTPINALVDISNYITYDLGHPLHIYDADKVLLPLTITESKKGDVFQSLQENTPRTLPENILITKDHSQNVHSIAGIVGSVQSGCAHNTRNILLECAVFQTKVIARHGRSLNITSDARTRFERGVDAQNLQHASEKAIALIQELCGGQIIADHLFQAPELLEEPSAITLHYSDIERRTGCVIPQDRVHQILENLGCRVISQDSEKFTVYPPTHRHDLHISEDLVEEVLRIHGYAHIPSVLLPSMPPQAATPTLTCIAQQSLAAQGYYEAITWSFMAPHKAELFADIAPSHHIDNPISQDLSVLRPSVLGNLLDIVSRNQARNQEGISVFEVGPIFQQQEENTATFLRTDQIPNAKHWSVPQRSVDFYDIKADVYTLLSHVGIHENHVQVHAEAPAYYHPGRCATLKQGNRILAYLGEIHPSLSKHFDYSGRVIGAELFIDRFPPLKIKKSVLTLSRYPSVMRDFCFVLPEEIRASQIVQTARKSAPEYVHGVDIFDVYSGPNLPEGHKSITINVRLSSSKKTLTDDEIHAVSQKIIENVNKSTGAVLRQ